MFKLTDKSQLQRLRTLQSIAGKAEFGFLLLRVYSIRRNPVCFVFEMNQM